MQLPSVTQGVKPSAVKPLQQIKPVFGKCSGQEIVQELARPARSRSCRAINSYFELEKPRRASVIPGIPGP